jgi:hypothetical protein
MIHRSKDDIIGLERIYQGLMDSEKKKNKLTSVTTVLTSYFSPAQLKCHGKDPER